MITGNSGATVMMLMLIGFSNSIQIYHINTIDNLDENINERKKILACYTTSIIHGEEQTKMAQEQAERIFENKQLDSLPELTLDINILSDQTPIYELLYMSNIIESKGAARKLIRGRGVSISGTIVGDELLPISRESIAQGIKISVGKKKHFLIKCV